MHWGELAYTNVELKLMPEGKYHYGPLDRGETFGVWMIYEIIASSLLNLGPIYSFNRYSEHTHKILALYPHNFFFKHSHGRKANTLWSWIAL